MDTSTLQLLSSALQDLGRGLKKLRCVVDRQSAGTKTEPKFPFSVSGDKNSPTEMKTEPKVPFEIESEMKREFCISNGTKIPEKLFSAECEVCILRGHEPKDWLFHEKNPWNSFHATCTFLFGQTLRGDRFKNQWQEDKTCLKGWRKVSAKHMHEFYIDAYRYHDDCATMVQFACGKDDFASDWHVIIPD